MKGKRGEGRKEGEWVGEREGGREEGKPHSRSGKDRKPKPQDKQ